MQRECKKSMKDRSFQMVVANRIENSSLEWCLPQDITINILKRLPVKTLTQFKCVAKDWLKLIESPHFIDQHRSHSAANNSFLLIQESSSSIRFIGHDLKFHNSQLMDVIGDIIGCCNGLLCVRSIYTDQLFIWNPATRQVKKVPALTLIDFDKNEYEYQFGFGFSQLVNDYKIVRISESYGKGYIMDDDDDDDDDDLRINRAVVYSLTTGSWKEINVVNLQKFCTTSSSVTANGAIFWQVELLSDPDEGFMISFDIAQEVFTLLRGPPRSQSPHTRLSVDDVPAVHNDKLAIFRRFFLEDDMGDSESDSCSFDVWVLEDTCAVCDANWIKMYSVGPFLTLLNLYPSCFWRDGIVSYCDWEDSFSSLSITSLSNYELKELHVTGEYGYYKALINYKESLIPVDNIHRDQ